MKPSTSHRLDLALPIGATLILSTLALLVLPGIATIVWQFLAGLILVGIFALRKILRYARERRAGRMHEPLTYQRAVDRADVLLLIGFAALYAAVSGSLVRAGWPTEAVRACGFLLLLSVLLLRPKIAVRLRRTTTQSTPFEASSVMSPAASRSADHMEIQ